MEHPLATISDTVWFTPALLVMTAMTALLWEVVHQKSHAPVHGLLPRPPGESFRLDLRETGAQLVVRLLFTLGVAVVTGVAARMVADGHNYPLVHGVMFTGSGIALALTLWTWRLTARWRNSHVGLEAERMVGHELNLLMLDGCRVFHDLVDRRIGNLDHIIVAPHAVFVVETQTWNKDRPESGPAIDRAIFNGRELRFPRFTTNEPIVRAARNAKWLEKYISRNAGIQLPVHPIVTLPGWTVDRTGQGPVTVVNPKEIASVVVDRAATPIYEAQRQPIINLLDRKCRSTPF